ncbi:MAG: AMP-binding protein [Planctomycetaceae bacterium]|nr:AMP-binding protein [Planctomycetaceae bacterium]
MFWIAIALFTLAVCATLIYLKAGPFMIFSLRTLLRILYRPKFIGTDNIPQTGGVMLVCNHVSLLDGMMLYAACPRNVRFIAYAAMVPTLFEPCARETKLIKIMPGSPKNVIKAVREAREALQNGEIVGIFAEGGITRNGQVKGFEPGFMAMMKGVTGPDGKSIPVIPCYIDGLHESMFGYKYSDKKFIFRPRKLLSDVLVSFGKPMYDVKYPQQVQLAVQELGVDSRREHNKKLLPIPARQLIGTCKKHGRNMMFADSTGIEASGYKFLTAALALRSLLKKSFLGSRLEEPHIGLLAPMSVGGCMLNAAVNLDRRVPVNLNFTFGAEGINYCIKQAGIKTVLTSRRVLERFPEMMKQLEANVICTEDLIKQLKPLSKIKNLIVSIACPKWLLEWKLGLTARNLGEELLAIIYTSGSTGLPKGVMLTNDNISSVGHGFVGTQRLNEKDTLLGFLPLFHSFGLMGNFWLPILSGAKGVFHFSPLEPKKIGEMARKYAVNFMPSTPTFLRNYLRHCPKEDFEHVPAIICGAEKLPVDLIDAWHEKYGVRPTEGFGTTELSPVMATNVPACRVSDKFHIYHKDGSIGRPIVGVAVKVIDLDTGVDLPPNEIGMIVAKGPTVMKGYYKEPEKTAEVLKDGWYTTGDVGKIDEDGFIWVTGRQSRISKIGGEMVPHILIEEEIVKILSAGTETESTEPLAAVTALPHPTRGEQIIVFYRDSALTPAELVEKMVAVGLPRIWIPHVDGFIKVDSIPVLGTGKLDLAAVKRMAQERRT